MSTKISSYRLEYLDWVRGIGAIIMLQGHVFHSFLRPDLKASSAYTLSQFVGGMPPALFLFLTGVTLAFLMDSTERKGISGRDRVWQSLSRSGYLFFLAFAFRLQLWIFGLPAPWEGLFKVDVLNCMGISIALFSVMALFKTAERIRLCAILGLAIALASPVISSMDWSGVPWIVRNYIIRTTTRSAFFRGRVPCLRRQRGQCDSLRPDRRHGRCMQWAAILGGVLILLPAFANSSFTLWQVGLVERPSASACKVGVLFIMVALAFTGRVSAQRRLELGPAVRRHFAARLLVHIELVYGRACGFSKTG
jgi:hypothetical protein